MTDMNKNIVTTQRWPKSLLERIKRIARAERRSTTNMTLIILQDGLRKYEKRIAENADTVLG